MKILIVLLMISCAHKHDHDHDHASSDHEMHQSVLEFTQKDFETFQKSTTKNVRELDSLLGRAKEHLSWFYKHYKEFHKSYLSSAKKVENLQKKLDASKPNSIDHKRYKLELNSHFREMQEKYFHEMKDFETMNKLVEQIDQLKKQIDEHHHHNH